MRSEMEIRKSIKRRKRVHRDFKTLNTMLEMSELSESQEKEIDLLKWVLGGEARYSIKELEKLAKILPDDCPDEFFGNEREKFKDSLEDLEIALEKDPKKAKELLERD